MPAARTTPPIRAIEQFEALEATLWDRTRDCFEGLEDWRKERGKRHPLADVVLIALIAMICGADDADEISAWAEEHTEWLSPWFSLEHGTPSQDTFLRVFAALEPKALRETFAKFVELLVSPERRGHIAIDGKTLRGSFDAASGKAAVHVVSAWLNDLGLVLGQVKTEAKSNEITAIPLLLKQLRLEGCTVTIDAAGCQKEIARAIVDGGGHYVLAVKGNQPTLHQDILKLFAEGRDARRRSRDELERPRIESVEDTDNGHGRVEKRTAYLSRDLSWLSTAEAWPGLRAVGMVASESMHERTGKRSEDQRTFIVSDAELNAAGLLKHVRDHWGVESKLHWVLDVDFGEDASRVRAGFAAENLAVLRHTALNLLRHEKSYTKSVKLKRKRCAWRRDYLLSVLGAPVVQA